MVLWSRSYRFLDLTVFFELGLQSGVVGVPCKATRVRSEMDKRYQGVCVMNLPDKELRHD